MRRGWRGTRALWRRARRGLLAARLAQRGALRPLGRASRSIGSPALASFNAARLSARRAAPAPVRLRHRAPEAARHKGPPRRRAVAADGEPRPRFGGRRRRRRARGAGGRLPGGRGGGRQADQRDRAAQRRRGGQQGRALGAVRHAAQGPRRAQARARRRRAGGAPRRRGHGADDAVGRCGGARPLARRRGRRDGWLVLLARDVLRGGSRGCRSRGRRSLARRARPAHADVDVAQDLPRTCSSQRSGRGPDACFTCTAGQHAGHLQAPRLRCKVGRTWRRLVTHPGPRARAGLLRANTFQRGSAAPTWRAPLRWTHATLPTSHVSSTAFQKRFP